MQKRRKSSSLIGPKSSYTQQCVPFFKVQCRDQTDTLFYHVYVIFPKFLLSSGFYFNSDH